MEKSRDAFRTISEVADWLGTPTHVLRFWESRFSQVKPVKRAGGRRYYRPADMELLGGIKTLLHDQGLTIRGVQKILREEGVKHVSSLSPSIDDDAAMTIFPAQAETPAPTPPPREEVAEARMVTDAQPEPEPDNVVPMMPKPPLGRPAAPSVEARDESEPETAPTDPGQSDPGDTAPEVPAQSDQPDDSIAAEPGTDPETESEQAAIPPDSAPHPDDETDTAAESVEDRQHSPESDTDQSDAEDAPAPEPERRQYAPVYAAPFSRGPASADRNVASGRQDASTGDSPAGSEEEKPPSAGWADDAPAPEPTDDAAASGSTDDAAASGPTDDDLPFAPAAGGDKPPLPDDMDESSRDTPDDAQPEQVAGPEPIEVADPMDAPPPPPTLGDELIERLHAGASADPDALRPVHDRLVALRARLSGAAQPR